MLFSTYIREEHRKEEYSMSGEKKVSGRVKPIIACSAPSPVSAALVYHRVLAKGLDPDRPVHPEAVVKLDE